jgi:LPXTG-motif cell wall-anchored protein
VYIVFDVGVGTQLSGARLTIRGAGLRPGSSFTVTAHSTPVVLATVEVGTTGAIKWDGTLPADLPDGEHTVDVLATAADGTAVGRVASFAVGGGVVTRIGAAVPDTSNPASTVGPPATTSVEHQPPTSTTTDAGGGSGNGMSRWLPLLGVTAVASGAGALWRRRKRTSRSPAKPEVADPATEDASRPRPRTTPRRRARSRRRPVAAHAGSPR